MNLILAIPWWFEPLVSLVTVLGLSALGVFGFIAAMRTYLEHRERVLEKRNEHANECLTLMVKNEEKYQELQKEIRELEEEMEKGNEMQHKKYEQIQANMHEYHKDTIKVLKQALFFKSGIPNID